MDKAIVNQIFALRFYNPVSGLLSPNCSLDIYLLICYFACLTMAGRLFPKAGPKGKASTWTGEKQGTLHPNSQTYWNHYGASRRGATHVLDNTIMFSHLSYNTWVFRVLFVGLLLVLFWLYFIIQLLAVWLTGIMSYFQSWQVLSRFLFFACR